LPFGEIANSHNSDNNSYIKSAFLSPLNLQIHLFGCNFRPFGVPNGKRGQNRPLVFFGTSQNLTGIDDELYGFGECTGCNSPFLQNEFFGKDAIKDLLFGSNV
jgi:hypothetical protein